MYKLTLAFCLLPSLLLAQQKSKTISLNGSIRNMPNSFKKVYISYRSGAANIFDSAIVIDNAYYFNVQATEPVMVTLKPAGAVAVSSMNHNAGIATIFLSSGQNKVAHLDSFSNVESDSKAHADYVTLQRQLKPLNAARSAAIQQYMQYNKEKNEAGKKEVEAQIDTIDEKIKGANGAFVKSRPTSPIALFALNQYAGYHLDPALVEPLFKKLPASVQAGSAGKSFKEKIEIAQKTGVGQMAMDFTQNDPQGNPVTLSSFRGKYVLLDFWASWCGPCRAENPNLVKAFELYKGKGFHVLGVSLDRQDAKEKWLKAIQDDHLAWSHVSDLQFWNNAVAKQYGIQAIPQNVLIDPQGKIIAKNLRGEELHQKLATLFN